MVIALYINITFPLTVFADNPIIPYLIPQVTSEKTKISGYQKKRSPNIYYAFPDI
ncbi:hypothetical protein [[Phormidium ambiguum] IAM M-71]|uniref:hypothetical protein n=1 Tax=[Phormidium ambiguum] IAM M-71 TaxID=454136 RepID=UPI0015B8AEE8|nr:hypothetical protein [Phormidium ambiguum]